MVHRSTILLGKKDPAAYAAAGSRVGLTLASGDVKDSVLGDLRFIATSFPLYRRNRNNIGTFFPSSFVFC